MLFFFHYCKNWKTVNLFYFLLHRQNVFFPLFSYYFSDERNTQRGTFSSIISFLYFIWYFEVEWTVRAMSLHLFTATERILLFSCCAFNFENKYTHSAALLFNCQYHPQLEKSTGSLSIISLKKKNTFSCSLLGLFSESEKLILFDSQLSHFKEMIIVFSFF